MDFFMRIKRKMRNSNIIFAIICFVLSIYWLSEVFSTGFSSDKDYTYTLRGLGIEVPVPNWLLSAFFLVLGVGALATAIFCLVVLIKGKDFNEFINMTGQYGNVEYIGNILENTPKSPYVKFFSFIYQAVLQKYIQLNILHLLSKKLKRENTKQTILLGLPLKMMLLKSKQKKIRLRYF